jgi:hypothetical protein
MNSFLTRGEEINLEKRQNGSGVIWRIV